MEIEFGPWLKRRRRTLDLTQEDLAARAFCSVNTERKIEAGDLMPSKELALALARALEITHTAQEEFVRFARTRGAKATPDAFAERAPDTARIVPLHAADATGTSAARKFRPPAPLTGMVGREHDTTVVERVLGMPATRLVTLTGPPGTGKTRLAIEVAQDVQDDFEHGAAFVRLVPVRRGALVESAIAEALDLSVPVETTAGDALRTFLRDKRLLLVLDNWEHLLDAANVPVELLQAAPGLKILATSRERLRVYGEREIQIAPLGVPASDALPKWDALEGYSSVQLFVERAQQVKPAFSISPENAEAVARLCVGLDGLPLAIEMAAARVKWETPQALLPQLARRLETLRGRERDADPQQQTLRGAMDWSYDLLDETERRVLRCAGVFQGGFTREAAERVCGVPQSMLPENAASRDVGEVLESLIEKSLVKQEQDEGGGTRYLLLETVREYALERLTAAGEADAARERHLRFVYELAQSMGTNMARVESAQVFGALKREQENVRAALEWALGARRDRDALNLAAALVPFWYHASAMREALRWLEPVLAMSGADDPPLLSARARVRNVYADFLRINGDMRRARTVSEQAIEDWKRVGKEGERDLAFAYVALARTALWQGEPETSVPAAQAALELYRMLKDTLGEANALRRLGEAALAQMDYGAARGYLDSAVALTADSANVFVRAVSLLERGDVARAEGDTAGAREYYRRAAEVNARAPEFFLEMRLMHRLALAALMEGDVLKGKELLMEAARRAIRNHTRFNLVLVFKDLAYCAAVLNDPEAAMRWTGVMENLLRAYDAKLVHPDRREHERTLALVGTQATVEELARWRREGMKMTMGEVLEVLGGNL